MTSLRLVLADDEPLVLQGLRMVLEGDPDFEIVGEAPDGRAALQLLATVVPDMVLTDIRMPRMDGIELTRRIRGSPALTEVRVVVLTTFADDDYLVEAARAGAAGYLLKSMPPGEIRAAVRAGAAGAMPLAPVLVRRLLTDYRHHRVRLDPRLDRLTERETEVLRRIAAGESNTEISRRLFIGEGTVKTHVASILRKLSVRDRTQAAVAAYELGLVRPGNEP